MAEFKKRETKHTLNIEGHVFTVDFSRDDIVTILEKVNQDTQKVDKKHGKVSDAAERRQKILEDEKKIFFQAINELLEDETASDVLFAEDRSEFYISEVYLYIAREYAEFRQSAENDYLKAPSLAVNRG